jgi:IS605 OrfB family transposase
VPTQPLPDTGQECGIDLGIEAFATLSNGIRIFSPGWYRKAECALKTAQRRVSRRKKGSNRRRKAVTLLAKAHQKVRRQRADFHHKTALALVRANDTIYHEDLQTANMLKNHHLAKSISDAGWSAFLSILAFKAAYAGKRVAAVPSVYTSQMCSGCGVIVQKGLSIRWHSCPECGTSLHRDHNAAKNIERAGQARRGWVTGLGEPRIRRGLAHVECQLTRILQDGVASGVSLGFLTPLDESAVRRYWQHTIAQVEAGERVLLVARAEDGSLVGSAQLNLTTAPNGRHRAEVQKVCVLRSARGQGIGKQLMLAIEEEARAAGRTLLVLDTRKDSVAEGLYRRLGYQEAGVIPGYARTVDGSLVTAIFFYRTLD